MASKWTSKSAILQDLSFAQGREVPVAVLNPVICDEKPPARILKEETEEEFFADYVGGDTEVGPDLKFIKQMLDMVRDIEDIRQNDTIRSERTTVEIRKIDCSLSSQRKTDQKPSKPLTNKKEVNKPKKERNVAISSLIEIYGEKKTINSSIPNEIQSKKILEPDDIVYKLKKSQKGDKNDRITNMIPTFKSPMSMFSKKTSKLNEAVPSGIQNKNLPIDKENITTEEKTLDKNESGRFVPSSQASELYKTYLEKSKSNSEQVKEDVWTKAMREMKEYEAKIKIENSKSNKSPLQNSENSKSEKITGLDFVRLPQHRHLLTGDCTVCEVLCMNTSH